MSALPSEPGWHIDFTTDEWQEREARTTASLDAAAASLAHVEVPEYVRAVNDRARDVPDHVQIRATWRRDYGEDF